MIRFRSPSSGDVSMLDAHARRLLDLIGKSAGERGVITHEQIPQALAALRAAIQAEGPPADDDSDDPDENARHDGFVDLGRRAFPLIDMLERAARHREDVTWGL